MAPDDEILEAAARDGAMDSSTWPGLLERVGLRLDHIVYHEFPIPTIPFQDLSDNAGETPQSPNAVVSPTQGREKHVLPSQSSPSRVPSTPLSDSHAIIPDSQPSGILVAPGALPPQLLAFYTNIKTNLTNSFPNAPPFTVQRLSELILRPSAHYKTLPSYLRAVDRTISVSSTSDAFPLPLLSTSDNEGNNYLVSSGIRSLADDFNGAALTRIPWMRDTASMMMSSDRPLTSDLRTESTSVIDGPNGAGSIETVTVSVNGFSNASRGESSQRQENAAQSELTTESDALGEDLTAEMGSVSRQDDEADEERVHARGPEVVGVEDMGPQQAENEPHVFDAEAALGRPGEAENVAPAEDESGILEKDKDGDTIVPDAAVLLEGGDETQQAAAGVA